MPTITLNQTSGDSQTISVQTGDTLMKRFKEKEAPGIMAECGGAAACGTCMIVVDPAWRNRLPAPSAIEQSMLDDEPEGTRLSCQISVTDDLDGLIATVPDRLY